MELTQENLNKRFSYDHETGRLFWRKRDGSLRPAGWVNEEGYKTVTLNGKRHRVHRVIWIMVFGLHPEAIDHVNGERSDNRLANLRSVTVSENNRNQRLRTDNKSGIVGVSRAKYGTLDRGWRATIAVNGKDKHVGYFRSFAAAVSARKQAEKDYGFHRNHGRI